CGGKLDPLRRLAGDDVECSLRYWRVPINGAFEVKCLRQLRHVELDGIRPWRQGRCRALEGPGQARRGAERGPSKGCPARMARPRVGPKDPCGHEEIGADAGDSRADPRLERRALTFGNPRPHGAKADQRVACSQLPCECPTHYLAPKPMVIGITDVL